MPRSFSQRKFAPSFPIPLQFSSPSIHPTVKSHPLKTLTGSNWSSQTSTSASPLALCTMQQRTQTPIPDPGPIRRTLHPPCKPNSPSSPAMAPCSRTSAPPKPSPTTPANRSASSTQALAPPPLLDSGATSPLASAQKWRNGLRASRSWRPIPD